MACRPPRIPICGTGAGRAAPRSRSRTLIATARAVRSANVEFRRQARAGMRRVLGAHTVAQCERTSLFRIYEHNVIPGLFQTAAGIIPMMTERAGVASAGFWIFDDSLVALEIPTASIEVTRPREIELYARMFGHLQSSAACGAAARALIIRVLSELRLGATLRNRSGPPR